MSSQYVKQSSLKNRIIYSMLLVILSEFISFIVMVNFIDIFKKFDNQSFRIFNNQVNCKADNLKTILYSTSNNLNLEVKKFNKSIDKELDSLNISADQIYLKDDVFKIVEKMALFSLLDTIDKNYVTGAFVIFNGSNNDKYSNDVHSTIYLNCNKKFSNKSGESDYKINMRMGNKNLAQDLELDTKYYWKSDYDFVNGEEREYKQFYEKPVKMAKMIENEYIDTDLGYWSPFFENFYDKVPIITYTVPLIDLNGNVYGVYGIEFSMEYISEIISSFSNVPYSNLPYSQSFMLVGEIEDNKILCKRCFSNDQLSNAYLSKAENIELNPINKYKYVKTANIKIENKNRKFYVTFTNFNLNELKRAYVDENFKIILFAAKDNILLASNLYKNIFLLSLGISIIFLIFISKYLIYSTVSKLKELSNYIANFKGDKPLASYITNLEELNELVDAINKFNNEILDYGKRMSTILDMTKIPIGCFEDREKADMVFVTSKFLEILGIDKNLYEDSYIPKHDWHKIFFKILDGHVKGKRNIYRWKDNENSVTVKWLRFESAMFDDRNIGILMDVTEDMRKQTQLEFELDYDVMTHLLNRNAFKRKIVEVISYNPNKIGAVIFADLDNLKYINDTYGHDIGDKYIITAAEMFSFYKSMEGIIARVSGDEFAMFIYGFDNLETAKEKVYGAIKKNNNYYITLPDKKEFKINCSLGIAWYGRDSQDIILLMKYADFAMYECKSKNKGDMVEFDKESYEKNVCISERKNTICKIIEDKLISYVFQPIISVNSCEIVGYEAFMKCKTDEFKTPLEILSVAEVHGKLYDIEKLNMFMLVDWIVDNKEILDDKKIFINTICTQILSDEDFNLIEDKLEKVSGNIVYELTNDDIISEIQLMRKLNMIRNKANGIIAIDDSSSGYINEFEILNINPDIVKIDRKIISNISVDKDKQRIVGNLLSYYRSNNIKTVAICVEKEEELETLIKLGIDMVQGDYFSPPREDIVEMQEEKKLKLLEIKQKIRESIF